MTEDNDRELRELAAAMWDGWNAGSGETFAAPFADDADYVVVDGMRIKGRAVIAAGHQQIFDTIYRGSQLQGEVESVRHLRPDVALVHTLGIVTFTPPGTPGKQEMSSRSSLVCVKDDGRWRIASFHNTAIVARPGMPTVADAKRVAGEGPRRTRGEQFGRRNESAR
jgi:uncharacterized protein (TIGR02246 family)